MFFENFAGAWREGHEADGEGAVGAANRGLGARGLFCILPIGFDLHFC